MFSFLKRKDPVKQAATEIYGSVVAQTRQPEFYTLGQVPDTLEGRFELLVMHMWLVIDRLRALHGSQHPLAKALTARFVTDIDDTYREFGIGDQSVPRKVKKATAALYDRTLAYRQLVEDANWAGLQAALAANIYKADDADAGAYLTGYIKVARKHLADVPASEFDMGRVGFPEPVAQFDS